MTTVEINRSGCDITSIDLLQTGSNQSEVMLKHDLLDSKLNYHFAVTSLSVPLNRHSIFKLSGVTELFRIERRDVGNSINDDLSLHEPGNNAAPVNVGRMYILPNKKLFDIASFVKDIANTLRGFNEHWSEEGFNPQAGGYSGAGNALPAIGGQYHFIEVKISADGTLTLIGSDVFWNNFVIRFTRTGAAILGFLKQIQVVERVGVFDGVANPTHYYIAKTLAGGAFSNDWLSEAPGNVGLILAGNMLQEASISSDDPLYASCDQRVKVTVESHIPYASNIAVVDEVETVDRAIATAYFESKLENQITFDEAGIYVDNWMQSQMYNGQTNFIKKSDSTFQWNRLLTAYELRLFRFQVYIHYRTWDDANERWTLTKDKLDVPKEQFWELSVRFVSDS